MKVNAGKTKMMMLGGEEGLECEACVDGMWLDHVLEFKYFRFVLDESSTDEAECRRKVTSGRTVASAFRSLVNARCLPRECVRVLHESLVVHVLMYGSEKMICKEKERSKIRVVPIDSLRSLLCIRRMDKVLNKRVVRSVERGGRKN